MKKQNVVFGIVGLAALSSASALAQYNPGYPSHPGGYPGNGSCVQKRSGGQICMGDTVIGLTSGNIYTVQSLFANGEAQITHLEGAYRGQTTRADIDRLARRTQCLPTVCEGETVMGKTSQNVYQVEMLFENGQARIRHLEGSYANQVVTAAADRLARETQCVRDVCTGMTVIGMSSGSVYTVYRVFEHGQAQIRHSSGPYAGQVVVADTDRLSPAVGQPGPHHPPYTPPHNPPHNPPYDPPYNPPYNPPHHPTPVPTYHPVPAPLPPVITPPGAGPCFNQCSVGAMCTDSCPYQARGACNFIPTGRYFRVMRCSR